MRLLLSEEDACCLGTQSCKTIIQKYFDDRLCPGFSEWPKQHIDAVNEISPLVSQVIPSHRAVTWLFRCTWRNLFGKCVSIVFYAHCFLSDKNVSYSNVRISFLLFFYAHLAVSIQCFFYAIFQNAHKNRWMEMQLLMYQVIRDNAHGKYNWLVWLVHKTQLAYR